MSLKLCYIWVEDYRNFQNTGFNFSSDEKFHFDVNTPILSKQNLETLPDNFFGNRIIDVTGLIGKNGSGKSNALELVCKLLKGGKTGLTTPFLIVTKEDDQLICYESNIREIYTDSNIIIKQYDRNIDPLKIIYFSNVFDERVHNFDRDISDISNNFRYPRNRYPYTLNKIISDFEKQVIFIDSPIFSELSIKHPERIRVTSNYWNKKSGKITSYRRDEYIFEQIDLFLANFKKRTNDIKVENKNFYYLIVYTFFIETLKKLNTEYSDSNKKDSPLYLVNELFQHIGFSDRNLKRTDEIVGDLINWMIITLNNQILNITNTRVKKDLTELLRNVKGLKDVPRYLETLNVELIAEGTKSRKIIYFIFDFKSFGSKSGKSFLELFRNQRAFNIDWVGISSGHKAYLNIFSLLNYEFIKNKTSYPNLLLCIDEGDLYLHPQWQIEFFDKLINVLPQVYNGNIQLILTSHSPFLLTDLPKHNITIIDSELNEKSTINGIELKKQTFAGNIYNLYAEPLFLENNRTSIFAKKKIQRLLRQLDKNVKGITINERSRLEKEINLIGDDVIKLHLLKKLNNSD